MNIFLFFLLLTVSNSAAGAETTYKSGSVAKVTAVRFEPTDASPMYCEIRVESSRTAFSFGIEGKLTRQAKKKSCDTVWSVRDEIEFRIVGQDIFIKDKKGSELKGRLLSPRPAKSEPETPPPLYPFPHLFLGV